ncbi:Chlorophyllase [Handroanthus impetiginosus]|uniref:Chlorophyllase n=1 Tax=Handroanthus impetiginosus TaxID=429701 RepID=A0A2G9H0C2_9LAMI|nr:Chlorophyllase [Handroanthus impetiginosus]
MATLPLEVKITLSKSTDVFEPGKYEVKPCTVRTSHATKPPVDLFIVTPIAKGTYPVLLFCHGFLLPNNGYSNLLKHIASHGYIVVAPQVTPPSTSQGSRESISKVTQWLSQGLPLVLPEKVNPDISNLALSGHSRGGKTAFALALGRLDKRCHKKKKSPIRDNPNLPKFKALIGIDPVAGRAISNRGPPRILEYIPRCFNMSVPVAVIGTGYGNQSAAPLIGIPPCAPDGVNHSEFFNESKPPACYFLAREYGHCDMLDDWIADLLIFSKSGKGRDHMRKCVGGIVVAFLKTYLEGDEKDLDVIVSDPGVAPTTLDPVIYVKSEKC